MSLNVTDLFLTDCLKSLFLCLLLYLRFLEIISSLLKEIPGYDSTLYRQCIKHNTIGNTDPSSENS